MRQKSVVVIGGGTGTYTVLSGLKTHPIALSAVVAMADDGGSTKVLREDFGVLPPGSVRPALVALSHAEKTLADLFNFRFDNGGLNGHNMGNLLITALAKQLGSFEKAIEEASKILRIQGRVIPSTLRDVRLCAQLSGGVVIEGERNIDAPAHKGNWRIERVWLEPPCGANKKAIEAVVQADLVVIGPGDVFTSIVPNFLAKGMANALKKSRAKKAYVCNIMTKYGETQGFGVLDFVREIEAYTHEGVLDYVIVNTKRPSAGRVKTYEKEKAEFVEYRPQELRGKTFRVVAKPLLRSRGYIRHDSDALARTIISLL